MVTASGLRCTVLGCCGSYAGPGGACSGYLVQGGGVNVWMDSGPGTLANLQLHIGLEELDALVLTHEHPDHWLDLPVFKTALKWFFGRDGLPVFSNASTLARARLLLEDDLDQVFDWHVVESGASVKIGHQDWTFAQTDHYVPTLATAVEADGRRFGYTADTGPGWSLAELGPVDMALCESSFLHREGREGELHLTPVEAAAMAEEAGAEHLVLTHLAPDQDPAAHVAAAQANFLGTVSLAQVGATYAA